MRGAGLGRFDAVRQEQSMPRSRPVRGKFARVCADDDGVTELEAGFPRNPHGGTTDAGSGT